MYRPIDVLTLSGVEQERRAVAVPVDFWGGITGSSPSIFSHSCSVDQTHIPHTNTAHQKIKKMFEQEIEVDDINASDSARGAVLSTHNPCLTPAHAGP